MASDIGKYTDVGSIPSNSHGDDIEVNNLLLVGPYAHRTFWGNDTRTPILDDECRDDVLETPAQEAAEGPGM